uniref:Uncharacterized protein n=1 Tax=Lygus hesperus TaxID=30085 RepID=A0A0A9WMD4_LYGHE
MLRYVSSHKRQHTFTSRQYNVRFTRTINNNFLLTHYSLATRQVVHYLRLLHYTTVVHAEQLTLMPININRTYFLVSHNNSSNNDDDNDDNNKNKMTTTTRKKTKKTDENNNYVLLYLQ